MWQNLVPSDAVWEAVELISQLSEKTSLVAAFLHLYLLEEEKSVDEVVLEETSVASTSGYNVGGIWPTVRVRTRQLPIDCQQLLRYLKQILVINTSLMINIILLLNKRLLQKKERKGINCNKVPHLIDTFEIGPLYERSIV